MLTSRIFSRGLSAIIAPALMLFGTSFAFGGVTVSVEAPGVQSSSRGSVSTETFDAPLNPGFYSVIPSVIGTYSAASPGPGAAVVLPDAYGGANQTHYLSVGAYAGGSQEVTLMLNKPESYFGFYFGAIDASNNVLIKSGNTVLTIINGLSLAPLLNASYFGNPNTGLDPSEAFAYVNVQGTGGQTFDSIVFQNFSGTGLETDNHSISAVPEPATLVSASLALLIGLGVARQRRCKIS